MACAALEYSMSGYRQRVAAPAFVASLALAAQTCKGIEEFRESGIIIDLFATHRVGLCRLLD